MKPSRFERFMEAMNSIPIILTWLFGSMGMTVMFAFLGKPFQAAVWLVCVVLWSFNLGWWTNSRKWRRWIDEDWSALIDRLLPTLPGDPESDDGTPDRGASGGT